MTEEKHKSKSRALSRFDLNSRSWKIFLVVLATVLTFAGPTYVVYVLLHLLEISYILSMVSGLVLFVAGLALMWYLIKNKVIS